MMNKKYNKKSGFSLFEALVSMLILSLFFIASSRVITQKHETEIQQNPRGYYECYIINGQQWQHRSNGKNSTAPVQTNNCVFEPPAGVDFVNFHYFTGSQYYNGQQIIMNEILNLGGPSGVSDVFTLYESPLQGEAAIGAFKTYLKLSHPTSSIYTHIKNGNWPTQATVIAW